MGMKKQKTVLRGRKACNVIKVNKRCLHDYKNAIKIGNVDYVCPLCKELLDPMKWFFMNSFEFVDVEVSGRKRA
jgi:hypothetical protein